MKRKPYRIFLYWGLRLIQAMAMGIPRDLALNLAAGIGRLAFWAARRERKKTLSHLSLAFGKEMTDPQRWELGRRVWVHFSQTAVDVLRFPKLSREDLDELIDENGGLARIDQVLSRGKGVILLTGHFGNWELMGAYLGLHGYPGTVVARRIYYEPLNNFLVRLRSKVTLKTIYQDAPARDLVKALRENRILGILADQDVDRFDGIFVPFFGRPAYTLTAPVKLARATGAPLLPAFLVRVGRRYRFLVEEPIYVDMDTKDDSVLRDDTERWTQIVEAKIRAFPEQWAWMHRRWKTEPSEEAAGSKKQEILMTAGEKGS